MQEILDTTKEKMQKAVINLENEFSTIKAGRANPKILDKIRVDYYGTPTPINQIASISVPEARMLVIQPWDISTLKNIEKEILKSDIGIMPQNDGKILRINFPQLTEDRRKEIAKEISQLSEKSKISIRNIRQDSMSKIKNLKKNGDITEDEVRKGEKKIQELTNKFVSEIESLCDKKNKEVMTI